jgi:hypothetical protein
LESYDRLNVRPNFHRDQLPCDGKVGDLVVLSPLDEGEFDGSEFGEASVWVCTKGFWEQEGIPPVWKRIQFDGFARCEQPVAKPPGDYPPLSRG